MIAFESRDHYPIDLRALPPTWVVAFVGDVCSDVQSGFASGEHNAIGDGVPHVRPMNVDRNGQLDMSVTKSVAPDVDQRRLRCGDVLFNNTNSPVLIGKTAAISVDAELAFSNHMTRLRPSAGIDYRFLARQLHYVWMGGYFRVRCTNHVNQASVSAATLSSSVPVVIPPANEQARIVEMVDAMLSRLDSAVESLDTAARRLKAYSASVLKAAVEGRLVPTEAELARNEGRSYEPADVLLDRILGERRRRWEEAELAKMGAAGKPPRDDAWKARYAEPYRADKRHLPTLPEGWAWASLEQLCSAIVDCPHSTPRWTESGRICVRTTEFQPGYLDVSGARFVSEETYRERIVRLRPEPGDILYSREGGILGIACQIPLGVDLCLGQRMMLIRAAPGMGRYVMHVLNSPWTLGRVRRLTGGSASPHLNVGDVKQFPVPLPPISEVERIVECLEDGLSVADASEGQIIADGARLTRLRQSILRWAFEGRLVDQDPNDEPADVLLARISTERETTAPATAKAKRSRKLKAAS